MVTTLGGGLSLRRSILVLSALVLLVGVVAAASATATYHLQVSNSIDGPEQTFTVEGETFRVSTLSYYAPGEPIEASVSQSGGDGSEYELLLYDSERRIEKNTRPTSGDGEFTFTTDDLPAGTYVLVVEEQEFEAVHPVVVQGYDVTLESQSTVATGESWTATASLDPHEDAPAVHAVEFVLLGEDTEVHFEASETGSGSYEASVTAPEEPGEYSFGVIVRGTNEVEDGEREPIAVSHPLTLDVQDGGSDADGGSSPNGTSTPTGTLETDTPSETDPGSTDGATPTGTDSSDGPITPADPTGTTPSDDGGAAQVDGQPGFGAGEALAALLATVALLRRRR